MRTIKEINDFTEMYQSLPTSRVLVPVNAIDAIIRARREAADARAQAEVEAELAAKKAPAFDRIAEAMGIYDEDEDEDNGEEATEPATVQVFPAGECIKKKDALAYDDKTPRIAAAYELAARDEGRRPLLKRAMDDMLADLDVLEEEMPNFTEALDMLRGELLIARLQAPEDFRVEPMLLDGPPGIGKTRFAHEVARILDVGFANVAMGTVSGAFELSGLAQGWGTTRPGRIATVLADDPMSACPVVLLDEVDKISRDTNFDPTPVLLELLERDTARRFRDECLAVQFDASRMIIVATSNNKSLMSDPLLSRLRVLNCREPNIVERMGMANRIIASYSATTDIYFSADAVEQIVESATNMREITRRLREEVGRALQRKDRNVVQPDDIRPVKEQRRAIGFV